MKKVAVEPESELARSLQEASALGEPLLVDTGDAIYRLHVGSREAPEQRGGGREARTPTAEEAARSIVGIRSAAGGWKDVDAEALKAYIRERRRTSGRARVRL